MLQQQEANRILPSQFRQESTRYQTAKLRFWCNLLGGGIWAKKRLQPFWIEKNIHVIAKRQPSTSLAGYCHGISRFLGCGLEAQPVDVLPMVFSYFMAGRCEVLNNVSLDELASIPRQVTERVHGKGWWKRYNSVICCIMYHFQGDRAWEKLYLMIFDAKVMNFIEFLNVQVLQKTDGKVIKDIKYKAVVCVFQWAIYIIRFQRLLCQAVSQWVFQTSILQFIIFYQVVYRIS